MKKNILIASFLTLSIVGGFSTSPAQAIASLNNNTLPHTIGSIMPLIGVSDVQGIIKKIYIEKDFIFLEVENLKGEIELFYTENNSSWQSKLKNLKENDKVNIRYALGTPKEYKGKMAMPLNDITEFISKSELTDKMWITLKGYEDVEINKRA